MLDLRLIMIDELGDEIEVAAYNLPEGLDELALDLWKDTKEREAREKFPEANGFYFEDRSGWNSLINSFLWC